MQLERVDEVALLLMEPGQVSQNWPVIEGELQRNLELIEDVFTPDRVLSMAIQGEVQVWLICEKGVARVLLLSQFYVTAVRKVFQVFYASGNRLVANFDVLPALEQFAAKNGASRVEVQGRKGFEKMLEDLGYRVDHVTYSKRVASQKEH